MKILKIFIITAVGIVSMILASHFTADYAAEISAKDKTLAEAIVQGQLSAEIQKAEEQAAEQLGDVLVTEDMHLKTEETQSETGFDLPETETVSLTTIATVTYETTTVWTTKKPAQSTSHEQKEPAEEEIVTEFTRGDILPKDRTGIPMKTMFGLSADEQQRVTKFLIEHYFLNGDVYVQAENRPALKEKKRLANDMERGVIRSLNMVLDGINLADMTSLMSADYGGMSLQAAEIRDEFEKEYKNASAYGEEFGAMYEDSLAYFNRLVKALERLEGVAQEYAATTNPLLAVGLLASALEDVVIPEILAVLEQSFDLVETSQEIFLEGTQGTKLLTRDEVKDIIINPAVILDTGLA